MSLRLPFVLASPFSSHARCIQHWPPYAHVPPLLLWVIHPPYSPAHSRPYHPPPPLSPHPVTRRLSSALAELFKGGSDAPILRIEAATFGAAGFALNQDVAALVAGGPSLLSPSLEGPGRQVMAFSGPSEGN